MLATAGYLFDLFTVQRVHFQHTAISYLQCAGHTKKLLGMAPGARLAPISSKCGFSTNLRICQGINVV